MRSTLDVHVTMTPIVSGLGKKNNYCSYPETDGDENPAKMTLICQPKKQMLYALKQENGRAKEILLHASKLCSS